MVTITKDTIDTLARVLKENEGGFYYSSPSGAENVYITDEDTACALREEAAEAGNYPLAKEYNRILAYFELVNKRIVYKV